MTKIIIEQGLLHELVSRTSNAPPGGTGKGANRDDERIFWAKRLKAIRQHLNCTQKEFADRYGIELRTLQNWEQAGRVPDTSSKALITLIERNPDHVQKVLAEAKEDEPEMA